MPGSSPGMTIGRIPHCPQGCPPRPPRIKERVAEGREKHMGIGGLKPGARLGLAAILVLAAGLRLWGIERNGFGTEYYAAGVLSMMSSLHNFFFASFDPAGFVSVDKPPVALWIQVASAELFGFSGFSVILPQVLEGLAAILLLYRLVARRFGAAAGLLAALMLAIMPVSVAVDRSSNTDSCLVLVLLLAAAAMIRAIERRSFGWLLAAMITVGIGFNVKMAAALGVVPAFGLAYLLAAPAAWRRRLAHLTLAGSAALIVGFAWFAAFDLVPPDGRPYAGSSTDNSMLQMVFVQYGIDRFIPHPGRGEREGGNRVVNPEAPVMAGLMPSADRVPIGPLRLADPKLGGQIGWFFPLAAVGALGLFRRRQPATPAQLDLILWSGWALIYGIVFSVAGGIFHAYYVVAMAPPVAALAGIGLVAAWRHPQHWPLPAALAFTGLWQAWLEHDVLAGDGPDWRRVLFVLVLADTALATLGLILARRHAPSWASAALALGLGALLATPFAWALSPVLGHTNISFPAADVALLPPATEAPRRGWNERPDETRLLAYIQQNRGDARYLLATQTAPVAAPLILGSGAPVMAVGGYTGTDPILTPEALAALVAAGQVRFFLLRDGGRGRGAGDPQGQARLIADWVKAHGQTIDPALWDAAKPPAPESDRLPVQYLLYDLRPSAPVAG